MAYTAIDDPSAYFKVQLYTGTGSENVITFNDTDTDMQPDMVWTKSRSNVLNHNLYDSVRGVNKGAKPNTSDAEFDEAQTLKSFNSDGFTVGTDGHINTSSATFVAWCWKANGTGSANTEGNTDTTISANTTSGFSIIDGCDTLNDDDTFGHGLDSAPNMVWLKRVDDASGWRVFYTGITSGSTLVLNDTAAVASDSACIKSVSSTLITSEGSGTGGAEGTGENVAYAWHSVQGYSKIGTYTGNGNADGTFVYTGFRPAYLLVKNTGGTWDWNIWDNKRFGFNGKQPTLFADLTNSEDTEYARMDFLSNGFKARINNGQLNTSGNTYVYAAFAEAPFVNSNGVPCNAR